MKITFFGGAKSVTGSNYLIESGGSRILVDCGMHQGEGGEDLNYEPFKYNLKEIDALFITHAHIDHIGMIPKLVRSGFRGKILSTHPTKDLAGPLLRDALGLLRKDAEERGAVPPFEEKDIDSAFLQWETVNYHEPKAFGAFEVEFYDAGHILGSSFISVKAEGKTVVFSGDLGNIHTPFIRATEPLPNPDYLLIESTYGGRMHENMSERKNIFEDIIEDTTKQKGTLLIPAFALERTQEMLFELNELIENGRVARIPVFVDSPLAIQLTDIYRKYSGDDRYFNGNALSLKNSGDAIFEFPGLTFAYSQEESKKISETANPKIIIAGSGMSQGGRIIFHEKECLPDSKNTLLFVGFQSSGSLGRAIIDGAKKVNIFGDDIPVRCNIKVIDGYSAHADQAKLLEWMYESRMALKKVFVVQGEEAQAGALAEKIRDELAVSAVIPSSGDAVVL